MQPGTRVAHFDIVAPLGAGGMGEVFHARDPRLGRDVALKFLPAARTDDHATERFMREARATSALSHPNIVTVYDIGESARGWFIAMELVRGVTLAGLAAEYDFGPTPLALVLDLATQAARALAAAHEAGIVHRDVKPENLMRRHDGYLKVLDFGLARLTHREPEAPVSERLTAAGTVLGTRRYFAPEQATGEVAGAPADVFALAVVVYELLSAAHPFPGDSPIARLTALITGRPTPLREHRPDAPPALDALLQRMLRPEPDERPDAPAVAAELARIVAGAGTTEPGGGLAPRPLATGYAPIALAVPERARAGIVVGRELAAAQIHGAIARARAGDGGFLLVTAEAGVGKTTLVEHCLAAAAEPDDGGPPPLVARGRCSERLAGTEAYLPVLEALDAALVSDTSGRLRNLVRRVAPTWYQLVGDDAGERISDVTPARGVDRLGDRPAERAPDRDGGLLAASPERVKREMVSLVVETARAAPLILFVDDLHWADASTSDLIAYLAPRLAGTRALLVGTYRAADMRRTRHPFLDVQLDLQARGACQVVALDALDAAAVDEFLARRYPDHRLPPEFGALLHARTEGHPLFLGDVLRDLGARGAIAVRDGHWRLEGALADIARDVPASVRSMIERKIAQLGDADRRLLAAASVQGPEFDAAAVAAALGENAAEVEERLAALDYAYALVRREGEVEFPDRTLTVRYRFAHALYHDALYAALSPSRRVDLAGRVAAAIEQRHGTGPSEASAALAALWVSARQPVRAAAAYAAAATRAAQLYAYAEAEALARGGLAQVALLGDGAERDAAELPLRLSLGFTNLVRRGFHHPDTADEMRRALALCRALGNVPQLAPVLWGLCVFHIASGDPAKGVEVAEELRRVADSSGDPVVRAMSDSALVSNLYVGRFRPALAAVEQTATATPELRRALRAIVGSDPLVISRSVAAQAAWRLGEFARADALVAQALDDAARSRDPRERAFVVLHATELDVHAGRAEQGARRAADAVALCDEYGVVSERYWNEGFLGMALGAIGRRAEAITTLRRAIGTLEAMQSWVVLTDFYAALAHALLGEGRTDEAAEAVAAGLGIAERTGEPLGVPDLLRARAATRGSAAAHEAHADLVSAAAQARAMEFRVAQAWVAVDHARLFLREAREDEARSVLAAVRADWPAWPAVPSTRAVDAVAASLASTRTARTG